MPKAFWPSKTGNRGLCQVFMVCRLLSVGAQQLERWGSVVLAESDQEDVKEPPGCMFIG